MSNIMENNGVFWKEIPFTVEAVEDVQLYNKGKLVVINTSNPNIMYDARVLCTSLLNKVYPIVIAARLPIEEDCLYVNSIGSTSNCELQAKIFKPSRFKTYKDFIPSKYQACLTKQTKDDYWHIDICKDIKDGTPIFYGHKAIEWLPLCDATEPLLYSFYSWKNYIKANI